MAGFWAAMPSVGGLDILGEEKGRARKIPLFEHKESSHFVVHEASLEFSENIL